MWEKIEAVLKPIIQAFESESQAAWTEFCNIVKAVFTAEEQVIMAQVTNMLKNDIVSLQNAQPGINSKDMENILKTNAQSALVSLGVQLAYTGILTAVGTAMHDLKVPDNTGNAGVVS